MASIAVAPTDTALSLLLATFGDLGIARDTSSTPPVSQLSLPSATVSGTNTIASHLATLIPQFSSTEYSDLENAEIQQWLTLSGGPSPLPESTLDALNDNLKLRTTLLGEKFSVADVVVYARIRDTVAKWSDEERTGEKKGRPYVVRWVDFVQNSPTLALQVREDEKVLIDVDKVLFHAKPEEAPKKEKKPAVGAAGAAGATVESSNSNNKGKKGVASTSEAVKDAVGKVKDAGEKAKDAVAGAAAAAATGKKVEKKQKPKREPAPSKEGMCCFPVLSLPRADQMPQNLLSHPQESISALATSFTAARTRTPTPSSSRQSPWVTTPALPSSPRPRRSPTYPRRSRHNSTHFPPCALFARASTAWCPSRKCRTAKSLWSQTSSPSACGALGPPPWFLPHPRSPRQVRIPRRTRRNLWSW